MNKFRSVLLIFGVIGVSFTAVGQSYGQNALLKELATEDQDTTSGKAVKRTDQERLALVLELLGKGLVMQPEDQANAALVLQHTGATYCDGKLISLSPDNYLLGHNLANSAYKAGYAKARWLVAASLDRYLSFTQGYQKYGTNRLTNPKTGKDEWVPIDRNTSDKERAEYGVAPLATLLKQFPEQQRKKENKRP